MRLSFSSSHLSIEQRFPKLHFVYFKGFMMFSCTHNSKQNSPYFSTVISHINSMYVVESTNYVRNQRQMGHMLPDSCLFNRQGYIVGLFKMFSFWCEICVKKLFGILT